MDLLEQTPIINTQVLPEPPTLAALPPSPKKSPISPMALSILIAVLFGIAGLVSYKYFTQQSHNSIVSTPIPTVSPTPTEQLSEIYQRQIAAGWYYGGENQKIPGTPTDWIYKEGGKSSCWHKPGSDCPFPVESSNNYTCPASEWVDCMPGPGPEKQQCQAEFLLWAKENCPGFQGAAL